MLTFTYTRRTYYVAIEDEQAIAAIKAKYGLGTDSAAVRLALRVLAESSMVQVPARKRTSK